MKKFLPIIIGILLSIPLAIGAFFLTQGAMTRANVAKPVNVKAEQISDTKAVISWTTDQESQAVVEYGTTPTQLNRYAPEILPKTEHSVELTLLTPNTPYYYKIRIGEEVFDNEGLAWTFRTKTAGAGEKQDVKGASDVQRLPTTQVVDEKIYRLPTGTATIILMPSGGVQQTVVEPTKKQPLCPKTSNCNQIQSLLGKGCSSTEYVACLKKGSGGNVKGTSTTTKTSKTKATPTRKPTLAMPETAEGE